MQAGAGSRPSPPPEDRVDLAPASDGRLATVSANEPSPAAGSGPTAAPSTKASLSASPEHATFHTSMTTTATTTPFLDKILSRVKMLGLGRSRARALPMVDPTAVPLRNARSGVPDSKSKAGPASASAQSLGGGRPDPQSESESTGTRRAASEMVTVAPPTDGLNARTCRTTMEVFDSDSRSIISTASFDCIFANFDNSAQRYKKKDLRPFCEQLERLLDNIRSIPDLNHIIYDYPSILQNKLDEEAKQLHSMLMEARAAHLRIQQVKNQKRAVRKGTKAVGKSLALMKDEEANEMENYIALYDKSLMTRWEKIRSSTQEEVVDSFVQDIKGKQKALDYLHTLATNKLNQLRSNGKQTLTEDSKPVSLALRRLSAGGGTRGTSGRWRNKHHERAMRAPSTLLAPDTNSSTHPAPSAGVPFNLTLSPEFVGTSSGGTSRTSSPSTFGSASSSLIPNITPSANTHIATNIVAGSPTPTPTLNTPERRSILQALFTDIQHPGTHDNLPINAVMPRLVGASSATGRIGRGNVEESQTENGSPGDDIELFTVQDHS